MFLIIVFHDELQYEFLFYQYVDSRNLLNHFTNLILLILLPHFLHDHLQFAPNDGFVPPNQNVLHVLLHELRVFQYRLHVFQCEPHGVQL